MDANIKFKNHLRKEIKNTNLMLNQLYIDYLNKLMPFCQNRYDIDSVYMLQKYKEFNIPFREMLRLSREAFSDGFNAIIQKHYKLFLKTANAYVEHLINLERLYSYYLNNVRFFNDFKMLEDYLEKLHVSAYEQALIINFYIDCTANFLNQEELKILELKNKKEILKYILEHKNDYDSITLEQLKEYLLKLNQMPSFLNNASSTTVTQLLNLNLDLSAYHLAILLYYNSQIPKDINYNDLIGEGNEQNLLMQEKLMMAQNIFLSKEEIRLLTLAEKILKTPNLEYRYYKIYTLYQEIANILIRLNEIQNEEALTDAIATIYNDLSELSSLISLYNKAKTRIFVKGDSN